VYLCSRDRNGTVKCTEIVMLNYKTLFKTDLPTKNTDRDSNVQKEMDKFLRNDVDITNLKHHRKN